MMCEQCSQTDGGPQGPYGPQKTCAGTNQESLNMNPSSCTLLTFTCIRKILAKKNFCCSCSSWCSYQRYSHEFQFSVVNPLHYVEHNIFALRLLKVGSISDCAGRSVRWEFCSSKLMMEKIPQLGFFPAGQDEFSAGINAQVEPRQPLTAAHVGTGAVGRHAFSCSCTKESWESSS